MEGWNAIPFDKCLIKHKVTRNNQVRSSEVKTIEKYPVVDQGQKFISGYTDDKSKLVEDGLPYIIFGDHTRCFKYVDFPFALGADGTKVLKPSPNSFSARFFYYAMLALNIPNRGYNRHFKLLKEKFVPLPPLPEQRRIAAVLSLAQKAIEQQERLIELTIELKKALMHKLFTEGVRGESQKQTEIGPVPESWEGVPLGDLIDIAQYGLSVRAEENGNYPMLRMTNQIDGKIVPDELKYVNLSDDVFAKFRIFPEDILFNRTNSFDLVGRTAIFTLPGDYVFASYLIRLRVNKEKLNPFFLNQYFNWDKTQVRLKSIATRAISQSNISATRLKAFDVPMPMLDEQSDIVKKLGLLDIKREHHQKIRNLFRELFHTLLHQLMTAEIRVDDLDLREFGLNEQL